jgi:hypothetical protein
VVNIGKGEQFSAEFVRVNPNSKIPCMSDREGPDGGEITLFGELLMNRETAGRLCWDEPRKGVALGLVLNFGAAAGMGVWPPARRALGEVGQGEPLEEECYSINYSTFLMLLLLLWPSQNQDLSCSTWLKSLDSSCRTVFVDARRCSTGSSGRWQVGARNTSTN